MPSFEELHARHLADVRAFTPRAVARLEWNREQVEAEQTRMLRRMVAYVQEKSPYLASRIGHLEAATLELSDLAKIPVLTKADVMDNWDQLVTDPRLKLADMNAHLHAMVAGEKTNPYYLDEFYPCASGGTSGRRGLYIWDWETFTVTSNLAYRIRHRQDRQYPPPAPRRLAVVCAGSLVHASRLVFPVTLDPEREVRVWGADEPMDRIVAEINQFQPDRLVGYATLVHELADRTLEGECTIRPNWIMTNSEPLEGEARHAAREAWGADIHNSWGSVEVGLGGMEAHPGAGITVSEDYLIAEPIGPDGKPVPDGEAADRVIMTKLFGWTLPILRYEMTDSLVFDREPNPDFPAYRRISEVKGRADTKLLYGEVRIHPMVFRSVLGQVPAISEYQVQQTDRGARILVITHHALDSAAVARRQEDALRAAGLPDPEVTLEKVTELPRHPETNKLKRFVPLT
ncbi:MAG: hypothetical protein AAGK14_06690 [Verrucomicrobiota bacterium]